MSWAPWRAKETGGDVAAGLLVVCVPAVPNTLLLTWAKGAKGQMRSSRGVICPPKGILPLVHVG